MSAKSLSIMSSVAFFAATIVCFVWLWSVSNSSSTGTVSVSENLKPIEIQSVKKEAVELLDGTEKNSDIPIPVPREKMGRTNPFENI